MAAITAVAVAHPVLPIDPVLIEDYGTANGKFFDQHMFECMNMYVLLYIRIRIFDFIVRMYVSVLNE